MNVLACLLTVASTLSQVSSTEPPLERFERAQVHMGATFTIVLYAPDQGLAEAAMERAFARVRELDERLSDYKPESELNRLSRRSPTVEPAPVSRDLFTMLAMAETLSKQTSGAFDVTVGPLTKLWRRARRRREFPPADMLNEARAAVGYQHVTLLASERSVELAVGKMRFDLGGIAKGYAVQEALDVLRQRGLPRALVNGGGDISAGDPPPDREGWRVGVAPLAASAPPSRVLHLKNQSIATSGDAWQFVEVKGRRYSHIVDPRTGLGLTNRSSVTVIAPHGAWADALASAVSVMGPERGVALIESRADTECLIVQARDDQGVDVHVSRGFPAASSRPDEASSP